MTPSRILVADDDPVLLAMGSESLIAEGHDVVTADDGDIAFQRFLEQPFDLLILDIDMPVMSGLSVLEKIRAYDDPARASTPVIMLTGSKDDAAINACYDHGATSFIAKPVSWLNMTHQVSFILRAEKNVKALRKAHERALQASKAKDATMITLRHELRSPLHVIKGFTELLATQLDERLSGEEKQFFKMISDAVDDMNVKMSRLYVYAEIISGSFKLTPSFTDVESIVRKAIENVSEDAEEKKLNFEVSPPADGPMVEMIIDEEKVLLAITELLDNAVKYSPEDSTISVSYARDPAKKSISITVEDNGSGIDEDPSKLFEAFVQGDDGLTRSSVGLGLGLTVAQSVAMRHHGDVQIQNVESGGLRTTLTINDGIEDRAAVA